MGEGEGGRGIGVGGEEGSRGDSERVLFLEHPKNEKRTMPTASISILHLRDISFVHFTFTARLFAVSSSSL